MEKSFLHQATSVTAASVGLRLIWAYSLILKQWLTIGRVSMTVPVIWVEVDSAHISIPGYGLGQYGCMHLGRRTNLEMAYLGFVGIGACMRGGDTIVGVGVVESLPGTG